MYKYQEPHKNQICDDCGVSDEFKELDESMIEGEAEYEGTWITMMLCEDCFIKREESEERE